MSKKDKELEAFISSLLSKKSLTWKERFDRLIDWKKENRGMKSIHLSVYTHKPNKNTTPIYKAFVMLLLQEAKGKFKDVTNKPL